MRIFRGEKIFLSPACQLFCAVVTAFLILTGCEEKLKPSFTSIDISKNLPSQESWNAKVTFTDSGRVSTVLHAGHIAVYFDRRYTILDSNITVDFFDTFGRHTSVLTARRGRVDDVTRDFEAHGNVVVVSDSGTTLRTEDLYWNNLTQKIHSPAFVQITSPREQIQGQGFESDQSLKHYTIFRVTGQGTTGE